MSDQKLLLCPKCGWVCGESEGIRLEYNQPIDGVYCLHCLGQWVSENFSRMVEVNVSDRPHNKTML